MPNRITQPLLTPLAAAEVGDITHKTLRNWLDRGQVLLHAGPVAGKWRRFSMWDCFRIAVAGRLVKYGVPLEVATLTAGGLMVPYSHLLRDEQHELAELPAAFH